MKTIINLLIFEALTPFYIFQVFSLFVWLAEKYYYYTIAIIFMSVVGIGSSIIQTRKVSQIYFNKNMKTQIYVPITTVKHMLQTTYL